MIKIVVSSGHKVPGALEYSSRSANVTIEAEVSDFNAVPQEAQRLLALAEAQARQHLNGVAAQSQSTGHSAQGQHNRYNQPRPSGNSRGAPRLASAAQVRYLRRLVDPRGERVLLQEHGVSALEELSSRACSAAIDRLRGGGA